MRFAVQNKSAVLAKLFGRQLSTSRFEIRSDLQRRHMQHEKQLVFSTRRSSAADTASFFPSLGSGQVEHVLQRRGDLADERVDDLVRDLARARHRGGRQNVVVAVELHDC